MKSQFPPKTAIVLHAWYLDVAADIFAALRAIETPFSLHVTTPPEHRARVADMLCDAAFPWTLHLVENRGRDILPFLRVLKGLARDRPDYVLKLHTKKSTHRGDGDLWRRQAVEFLVGPGQLARLSALMERRPEAGILGAWEHLAPLAPFWGINEARVRALCQRMGQAVDESHDAFIAGSMFFARTEALRGLLDLDLQDSDFETEAGQIDGTLAHAVERAFTYSAKAAGLAVYGATFAADGEEPRVSAAANPDFGFARPDPRG